MILSTCIKDKYPYSLEMNRCSHSFRFGYLETKEPISAGGKEPTVIYDDKSQPIAILQHSTASKTKAEEETSPIKTSCQRLGQTRGSHWDRRWPASSQKLEAGWQWWGWMSFVWVGLRPDFPGSEPLFVPCLHSQATLFLEKKSACERMSWFPSNQQRTRRRRPCLNSCHIDCCCLLVG